jgi:hypothetical protein
MMNMTGSIWVLVGRELQMRISDEREDLIKAPAHPSSLRQPYSVPVFVFQWNVLICHVISKLVFVVPICRLLFDFFDSNVPNHLHIYRIFLTSP